MKDQSNLHDDANMASVIGQASLRAAMGRKRAWWIGGGIVALIVIALILRAFLGNHGPQYRLAPVTRGSLSAVVTATGTLQPVNEVDLGPEISGQIDKVLVDFNDRVKAGQVLAVIDTELLNARVVQSRASLSAAKAQVENSKATALETLAKLERTKSLFAQGNASRQALDADTASEARARAAVGSAQAQVAVASATVSSDETSLAKAEIKSPIDGIVLSRLVEPGQVVAATFQTPVLFKLAESLSRMQLEVDVDEADIGNVKEGQSATFTVDAYLDRQFPATITQVRFAPKSINNVVTYQAVLAVDNHELLLRPGMTATASVVTAKRDDTLLAPGAAFRFQPPAPVTNNKSAFSGGPNRGDDPLPPSVKSSTSQKVWILKDGKPEAVDVKIGLSNGQAVEVVSGPLKAGDDVIIGLEAPKP